MLMHHGPENYDTAASRAASAARDKLNSLIERGRTRATAVLDAVETQRPKDLLVTADELAFEPDETHAGEIVVVPDGDTPMPLHRHALGQVADRAPTSRACSTPSTARSVPSCSLTTSRGSSARVVR